MVKTVKHTHPQPAQHLPVPSKTANKEEINTVEDNLKEELNNEENKQADDEIHIEGEESIENESFEEKYFPVRVEQGREDVSGEHDEVIDAKKGEGCIGSMNDDVRAEEEEEDNDYEGEISQENDYNDITIEDEDEITADQDEEEPATLVQDESKEDTIDEFSTKSEFSMTVDQSTLSRLRDEISPKLRDTAKKSKQRKQRKLPPEQQQKKEKSKSLSFINSLVDNFDYVVKGVSCAAIAFFASSMF